MFCTFTCFSSKDFKLILQQFNSVRRAPLLDDIILYGSTALPLASRTTSTTHSVRDRDNLIEVLCFPFQNQVLGNPLPRVLAGDGVPNGR